MSRIFVQRVAAVVVVRCLVGFFFKSRPIRSDLKIAKKYIILCKTLHSVDQHSSQLFNVAHKHFVNYTTHSSIIRTLCPPLSVCDDTLAVVFFQQN